MNKIEQNINLIDRYLLDQLSNEELNKFNQMLKNDIEFEKLFFEMDQLVAGIRFSSKTTSVEEKLLRLEQSLPLLRSAGEGERKLFKPFNIIKGKLYQLMDDLSLKLALSLTQVKLALSGVAATILILVGFLFNYQHTPGPDVLFISYFKSPAYENFGATREAGDQTIDPLTQRFNEAMVKYNFKDYQASINIINAIPQDKLNSEMKLYQSFVNIKLENYGVAKEELMNLMAAPDKSWSNQAKWYLALCLVRENKYDDAKSLLIQVKEFGSDHSKDAGELLKKINN